MRWGGGQETNREQSMERERGEGKRQTKRAHHTHSQRWQQTQSTHKRTSEPAINHFTDKDTHRNTHIDAHKQMSMRPSTATYAIADAVERLWGRGKGEGGRGKRHVPLRSGYRRRIHIGWERKWRGGQMKRTTLPSTQEEGTRGGGKRTRGAQNDTTDAFVVRDGGWWVGGRNTQTETGGGAENSTQITHQQEASPATNTRVAGSTLEEQ
jgi:hypothetical protein